MSYTYDPTNDIGRVRRTIPDKVEADAFWTDEEIQSFLDDEGGSWRRATALALETMASDDLLVLKVIQVQDITTNTDRMASALMKRAAQLRSDAATAEANDADDFESVAVLSNDFAYREHIANGILTGR